MTGELPPGFELDAPPASASSLPPGFQMDAAAPAGHDRGAVAAFANTAANTLTFGGARKLGDAITGGQYGADVDATNAAHNYASLGGSVYGAVAGGALLGGAMAGAEALPGIGRAIGIVGRALSPVKGAPVANVTKSLALNGAVGGGAALAGGQSVPEAAQTAAITAVGGAAVEKTAGVIIPKILPAAEQAWSVLAKKFNVPPSVVQSAADTHSLLTGGDTPNMAQLANYHQQGQLRALADANPIIADAAMTAKNGGDAPLMQQIDATNAANWPQTSDGLRGLRDAKMDQAIGPIRNDRIHLTPKEANVIANDSVRKMVSATGMETGSYDWNNDYSGQVANIANGHDTQMTVGALDTLRQRAAKAAKLPISDAGQYTDLRDSIGAIAEKHPGVAAAMDTYRSDSQYMDGFAVGRGHAGSGKPNTATNDILSTRQGAAGYEHGQALAKAEGALNAIVPSAIAPDMSTSAGVAQAAHAVITPSPVNVIQMLSRVSNRLPEPVQKIIANQLFSRDPAVLQQGIANLKRGGATNEAINRIGTAIGGTTSATIASILSQGGATQ